MNIFEKRPLSLILCVALSGFSVFALSSSAIRLVALFISLSVFVASQIPKFKKPLLTACAGALFFSIFCSFIYFDYIFYPKEYYGEECNFEAEVMDSAVDDKYQTLDLRLTKVNGDKCSYKIKLYLYDTENSFSAGEKIKFAAVLNEFENDTDFDFKSYYTARGFSATAFASSAEFTESEKAPLSYKFKQMRIAIFDKVKAFSGESAAALFVAGFLGERDFLSGQLKLDFQRIGTAHILALSGMHMALLVAFVDIVLVAIRLGRKTRICVECVFAFAYMAFTGFPISVCRAGVMLIISSVFYLLSGCKDSITSLFLAALLIVVCMPYSAVDIGFWLSIVATVGILMASEIINEKYNDRVGIKRFMHSVVTSLVFSLFAVAATAAISSFSFTSISVISIISTLVFSPIIELYIYYGVAVWLLGSLIPLGTLLASYESLIGKLAAIFSDFSYICVSTSFAAVRILFLVFTVFFFVLPLFVKKNKRILISLIVLAFVFVSTLSIAVGEIAKQDDKIIYFGEESDRILIKSEGKSALLDISAHKKAEGYLNNSLLSSVGIVELDTYIIANYSEYIIESAEVLLSNVLVKEIMLPMPTEFDEEQQAIELFRALDDYRTKILFYEDKSVIQIGCCDVCIPFRGVDEDCLALTLKVDDKIYSYLSSGVMEDVPDSEELIYVSSAMVFGIWGKKYTSPHMIDDYPQRLERVLVNDKFVYLGSSNPSIRIPYVEFNKNEFVFYE